MNGHKMKICLVTSVMLLMMALPIAPVSATAMTVEIGDSGFAPSGTVNVVVGDEVSFDNTGASATTITSGDGTTCDTGEIASGATGGPCTFSAAGTFTLTSSAGAHTLDVVVATGGGGGEGGDGEQGSLMELSPSIDTTVKLDRADVMVNSDTVTVTTVVTWSGASADEFRTNADAAGDSDGDVSSVEGSTLTDTVDLTTIGNPGTPVRTGAGETDPEGSELGNSDSNTTSWSGVTGSTTSGVDLTLTMIHTWTVLEGDTQISWGDSMKISSGYNSEETEYMYNGSFTATNGVNRDIQSCRGVDGTQLYDIQVSTTQCSTTFSYGDAYTGYSLMWDLPRGDGESDLDNDGVLDENDLCPAWPDDGNESASTANSTHGCADTDQDGYHDGEDKCHTQHDSTKAVDADGCDIVETVADTDNDGWNDNVDQCPSVSGTNSGCPDTDGDGVHDGIDLCDSEGFTTDENGDGCEDAAEIVYYMVHVTFGDSHVMGNVSNGTSIADALVQLSAPAAGSSADDMAADDPRHGTYSLCRVMTVGGEETCTTLSDATGLVTDVMNLRLTASNSSGDAKVHVVAAAGDISVAQGDWIYITGHTACNDADADGTCEDATSTFTSLEITSETDLTLILTPGGSSMTVTVGTADSAGSTDNTVTTGTTDTAAEDEGALPGFGLVIGLTATLGAALIAARRD